MNEKNNTIEQIQLYDFSTEKVSKCRDKPISSIFDEIRQFSVIPTQWFQEVYL